MLYTETDVMDYIEQEDVKFIRLVFTDMFGLQKNISIMPKELPKAFRSGISFDPRSGALRRRINRICSCFPIRQRWPYCPGVRPTGEWCGFSAISVIRTERRSKRTADIF